MKVRRPACSHGQEHWTPGGHCRICDRDYRDRKAQQRRERLGLAKDAAQRRGAPKAAKWDDCTREADRTNRIVQLMEAHWRASTKLERDAIDAEIARLSRCGVET